MLADTFYGGELMAANRILMIEDDKGISDAVTLNLQYSGYEYMLFDDGSAAARYLEQDHSFDLALLDIMLPGLDGFELFQHMDQYNIPVIYITAKTDSASEIKGLREGAEDYIVKPFEVVTLLVRIEKVLERTGKLNKIYRYKDIMADLENRILTKSGDTIELTPLEFDVFAILIKNKNRTVPRERILNEIWGVDWFGDTHTVDVRIASIRKKLGLADEIKTIPKTGYRLEERKK
jgi:DNA-binding response OmpR family regulator